MMQMLIDITEREIKTFILLLGLEKEKRKAILSADGRNLSKITAECEELILQIGRLEEQREEILKDTDMYELSAEDIAAEYEKENPRAANEFRKKKNQLKEIIYELQAINKDNENLLIRTSQTINRLLKSLQNTQDKTYGPERKRKENQAGPILINASV